MKTIITRLSFFAILYCCSIGSSFAQTFCLQMTEISNDGANSVVSIGVQGDASFIIGSSNLQLDFTAGAFGTPTLVSSPLAPPFYFAPTVTEPGPGQASINIELAFSDASGTIAAAPGFTEVAVINLPIANAALAGDGVTWDYNGGTTATVVFLDDDATQLFATSPACLTGFVPNLPAAVPDCPTLVAPADLATDVPSAAGVLLEWTTATTGGGAISNTLLFGEDPAALGVLGDVGVLEEVNVTGIDFETTYFWTILPTNDDGPAVGCSVFSFTTGVAPAGGTNVSCATATPIGEGIFTDLGPLSGAGASNSCGNTAVNASWYEYTATVSGIATVSSSIDLDEPDTRLSIHTDCATLDCIAFDDDGGEGFTSIATLNVVAGDTYFIEWDDRWSAGEFDFEVSVASVLNGCTDAAACNFDAAANAEDGSCVFATGCDSCSGETDGTGTVVAGPAIGDACDDGDPTTTGEVIGGDCTCTPPAATSCGTGLIAVDGVQTSAGILAIGGGEASNACFPGAINSIFYEYTATSTGIATISSSIDLDEPDTRLSVHSECNMLDCLASDDDGGEGFTSITTLDVVAGEDYYIEWDNRWDDGEFDFEINVAPVTPGCTDATACNFNDAANVDDASCIFATGCDSCSGETDGTGTVVDNPEVGEACDDGDSNTENDTVQADCTCDGVIIVLQPGQSCQTPISVTNGTTTSAGVDALGNDLVGLCASGANSVWYSYVATCTGLATVSSSIDLDEPDTRVSIYADCDSTCIVTDDDGGEGFTSIATFSAVAGETYFIEWDDRWDAGEFDFEISCGTAITGCTDVTACNFNDQANVADNASCIFATDCDTCSGETDGTGTVVAGPAVGDACDDGDAATTGDVIIADCTCAGFGPGGICSTAIPVFEGITTSGVDSLGSPGASNSCFAGATSAIWYAYTATSCDSVTVSSSIDLDQPDTRLSIHTDCVVLNCVASDDDSGEGFTSSATFLAEAGTTYFIEWDDRWDGGEFDFEIATVVDTCPTDFNSDGTTDGEDFSIFLGNFGLACADMCDCPTDFNGDGVTDGEDFSIFLGNFGLDCSATN